MRNTAPIVVAMASALLAATARAQVVVAPVDESATYDDGYDATAYEQFALALAPYGEWLDDPRYGRVWVPSPTVVGADFAPYATAGEWSLSQYGWTWASDYPWGWGPFHYGRWVTLATRRWAWVPGTTWGPAWVTWRVGDGFAGWAPLPPSGAPLASPAGDASCWRFVPASRLGASRSASLPPALVASVFPRTAWFNPVAVMTQDQRVVRYNPGPVALAGASTPVAPLARNALPRGDIGPRPIAVRVASPVVATPPVSGPVDVFPPAHQVTVYGGWPSRGRAWAYPSGGGARAGYPSTDYMPPGYPRSGYPAAPSGYSGGSWGGGYRGGGGFVGGGSRRGR